MSMSGISMIHLTRINHAPMVLNSDLIEHIESTPDTVISLISGQKLMVLETEEEIVAKIVEFRQAIQTRFVTCAGAPGLPRDRE